MRSKIWHLNNKGMIPLRVELFWLSIFVIALLIVAILVTRMSGQFVTPESDNNSAPNNNNRPTVDRRDFERVELLMDIISAEYVYEMHRNVDGIHTITVQLRQLIEFDRQNRLRPAMADMDCVGYSNINRASNRLNITSYLRCTRYTTSGFNSRYLD